ncbi:MAG TPA: 50S ribosomal protein L25/general stress protein Ctc [Thauera aminoaromatica]|jgi:large subunit ribosomal protein L25|uniref:Large ribosomal subunit protein bL25 n=2 Tax=Thauera aminoaromatica TaxID=164330 RepID=C4KBP6_THASP|nr:MULTISPECIES: 50S ribosomal protein L25/general stress protein Ctc [Thauera]MBL8461784.1 50S ribosomal protein L25/general stress protein Ctc [Thauera sp.]MDA0236118.1 50S ribosomal protein L25/general stress protein Ctc [Pseudomonadota bacterium]OPZ06044.1 MAG: 50S ribosomal protein L25 [Alphaproteobacteria bacterium ADurb.BinA305]ACR02221.1 ribosomal 5S rRNA E-loop binding protein Ctc/L25/TL5 [Thauera aminoaromatica]ENO85334.1 50S ribosomal protein L25/general stress protein Ctc [Thauera 
MQIEFKATKRDAQGTGASRRLRRAGRIPGILYGGAGETQPVSMDHNELYHLLRKEAFHASVLSIEVDGAKQNAVLRDVQWHPFKQQVLHLDFQRIAAGEKMHLKVPLHFVGADVAPAVKLGGCMISHTINELDVQCLPTDLPEFIEVDLSALEAGQSVHVSQIKLPAGVELVQHGEGDPVVATALQVKGAAEAEGEGEQA